MDLLITPLIWSDLSKLLNFVFKYFSVGMPYSSD